jgi:SAM-dependent methyltransferase
LTKGDFCYLPFADNVFDLVLDRESVCSNLSAGINRVFAEVWRVLRPGGLYLSFMYSTDDGHYKRACSEAGHAERVEFSTFSNFKSGTFAGTGNIHFFDHPEIVELCRGRFEILSLSESKMEQIFPAAGNQRAEFILVARK